MRDALNTKRTSRYAIGQILTGKHVRTADDVAAVAAFVAASSLASIDGTTFGLFDSPAFCNICSMDAGSPELDSGSEVAFTADDVGKSVDVQGAGPAGATLRSTIAAFINGGAVTLADNASSNVHEASNSAGGLAIWGNALNLSSALPQQATEDGASETRKVALTGDLDAGANGIVNAADPTTAQGLATKAYVDAAVAAAITPRGTVVFTGPVVVPAGWLECNGTVYNFSDYPDLAALLLDRYGGNGITTFAVPDLRGRMAIGSGTGSGLSPRAAGQTGGEETHTLTIPEMPAHDHSYNNIGANPSSTGFGNSGGAATTGSTGGDGAHNNMPPFLAMVAIIKY